MVESFGMEGGAIAETHFARALSAPIFTGGGPKFQVAS
jgi:hypothetical protein